jgi:uncharacterized protein YyaL (SSP411 family)
MRLPLTLLTILIAASFYSCSHSKKEMTQEHPYTNQLINESSPYLLQHAHNPVDWHPWNDQTLQKAVNEEKLLLISIGYAACHWCHVMEAESFEDPEVARVMNKHFINVKVDREERPDVDQIYISAVELMTGRAGWPLNVVALPDGRPVWGGTYFPKEAWVERLEQLQKLYQEQPQKLVDYARRLASGIKAMDLIEVNPNELDFPRFDFTPLLQRWQQQFDPEWGGYRGAPKFMLPNNLRYLLRHAVMEAAPDVQEYVKRTLYKMAYGGLYDQIGGGFARYSVDSRWHIPHFEKMLYDNAQLITLYSEAYKADPVALYQEVVEQTIAFVKEELTAENTAFYSSLDADSENDKGKLEEGAFYSFTIEELKAELRTEFDLFAAYYNVNDFGKWEDDRYVLIRTRSDDSICAEFDLNPTTLKAQKAEWRERLKTYRNKRKRPRLDDKSLTSWNAMMAYGLVKAYQAFGQQEYLDLALSNARFLDRTQGKEDGGLFHNYKNGKSSINGYLEDYAAVIQTFLVLHEVTLDRYWLDRAQELTEYVFDKFHDPDTGMFYFTSSDDRQLVSRPVEYRDNVIPASNSVMANNLFKLSHYRNNPHYLSVAKKMLANVIEEAQRNPGSFANWLWLLQNLKEDYFELVVTGPAALEAMRTVQKEYLPNVLFSGSVEPSDDFLVKDRFVKGKTMLYLCIDNSCRLPTENISETLDKIKNGRN